MVGDRFACGVVTVAGGSSSNLGESFDYGQLSKRWLLAFRTDDIWLVPSGTTCFFCQPISAIALTELRARRNLQLARHASPSRAARTISIALSVASTPSSQQVVPRRVHRCKDLRVLRRVWHRHPARSMTAFQFDCHIGRPARLWRARRLMLDRSAPSFLNSIAAAFEESFRKSKSCALRARFFELHEHVLEVVRAGGVSHRMTAEFDGEMRFDQMQRSSRSFTCPKVSPFWSVDS